MPPQTEASSALHLVGCFHFGCLDAGKDDPVGSLERALGGRPELKDCLLVLPEAFNVRGGYHARPVEIDELASGRLQTLSVERKIWFVVGLIDPGTDEAPGYNSAYLIDGVVAPLVLSRKRCPGGPLYSPCLADVDEPVKFRGIGLAARVCEDATENGPDFAPLLQRLQDLNCERNLLCIPAYMGTYSSRGVAARCAKLKLQGAASMVIALANGCLSHPSVIVCDGNELLSENLYQDQIRPLYNFQSSP